MTTVTSLTADRMLAIEAASVVDGDVVGDNLILTKHDGSQINAGSVRGPTGSPGPVGQDLPILTATPVLDVGLINQIRAGRQLTAADFTNMGLSAPLGLWNLSDLSDVSGNGRNLLNKGAVPFGTGINGGANTASQFSGSTAQVLYITDTGAADPFRIKTGSFGCWFKTVKRSLTQTMMSKLGLAGQYGWQMYVGTSGIVTATLSPDGSTPLGGGGNLAVDDDRWHFAVSVVDGTLLRIYVDCILDCVAPINGSLFGSNAAFNISGNGADAATAGSNVFFGRIDEAFVTADVLSEDQVRNLYCVKIPHTLTTIPSRASLNVHRRRKGATVAVSDFPTQPLRLYNFSGGSLGDEGSNGQGLSNAASALSVAGVDGSLGNAFNFNGSQALVATDNALPSGLATRSYGGWFKTSYISGSINCMAWGQTPGTNDSRLFFNAGTLVSFSGTDSMGGTMLAEGIWHHIIVTEDNASSDGAKRKLYVDGRLNTISTGMIATVLGGASAFRIGANSTGGSPFIGQIDGVFVCDYVLTAERIMQLYAKGSQTLSSSPKNPGDHVEAMSSSSLLATFDTLESQHTIDLMVAA